MRAALLFLLFSPVMAAAQAVVTVPLQQCVWRAGDNPAWAAANLDESGWQRYTQWQSFSDQAHLWFRCHADLGAVRGAAPPAIQISLQAAYELFVNGVRLGGDGNVHSRFFGMDTIRQYAGPADAFTSGPGTIALRITTRQPLNFMSPLEIHAGDMEALAGRRASFVLAQSSSVLRVAFWYPLIGVAGLMLLGLFYYDRSRLELLWLCMICMVEASLGIRAYCDSAFMNYPYALDAAVQIAANAVGPIVSVLFYFALARRRVPWIYWFAVAFVSGQWFFIGVSFILSASQSVQLDNLLNTLSLNLLSAIAQVAWSTAPFFAFWPYRQISRRMRPLAALCMVHGAHSLVWFAVQITGDQRFGLPNLWARWERGLLEVGAFVTASVLVGLLALLFRDQRLVTEERAVLAGEMQAASEIQHMLAPAKIDTAPGLKIDVAFHPMRDVGGDFYLCRVLPDGRQRVLVGDVSGKGAAAAMAATLLLGAAEGRDADSPAALLLHLNRVLRRARIGGFATCLCADFAGDGTVIIANAGHLAPYRRGEEVAVASGLPLGVADRDDNQYDESRFSLGAGETLAFLSDGVAEARNPQGELFGFERTAQISSRPAEEVARLAKTFGQADDITVLTVRRVDVRDQAPAGQIAAAEAIF